jgi:hypothetical protein
MKPEEKGTWEEGVQGKWEPGRREMRKGTWEEGNQEKGNYGRREPGGNGLGEKGTGEKGTKEVKKDVIGQKGNY